MTRLRLVPFDPCLPVDGSKCQVMTLRTYIGVSLRIIVEVISGQFAICLFLPIKNRNERGDLTLEQPREERPRAIAFVRSD